MKQNQRNAIEYMGGSILSSTLALGLSQSYSSKIHSDLSNVVSFLTSNEIYGENVLNNPYQTLGVGIVLLSGVALGALGILESKSRD